MKEIQLTQGKVALVDDEDYERIAGRKWHAIKASKGGNLFYAYRRVWLGNIKGRRIGINVKMHKEVLRLSDNVMLDHINGIGTDNRKANLRMATRSQNQWNARLRHDGNSGFKGVSHIKYKNRKYWFAYLNDHGKRQRLGNFSDPETAARAYDDAARKHFGEFARLNFPGPGERGCR